MSLGRSMDELAEKLKTMVRPELLLFLDWEINNNKGHGSKLLHMVRMFLEKKVEVSIVTDRDSRHVLADCEVAMFTVSPHVIRVQESTGAALHEAMVRTHKQVDCSRVCILSHTEKFLGEAREFEFDWVLVRDTIPLKLYVELISSLPSQQRTPPATDQAPAPILA